MKLLLDSCIWGLAKNQLQGLGHEAVWAGDWDVDPGDDEILRQATSERRILVTLDKDFGELVIVRGHLHSGIIRLVNFPAKQQASACALILDPSCERTGRRRDHNRRAWKITDSSGRQACIKGAP